MKRYKINMLVPHTKEILAADEQEARREAKRLTHTDDTREGVMKAVLYSVEFVQDEPEPIDFGFDGDTA
jgi:hypothetical protein